MSTLVQLVGWFSLPVLVVLVGILVWRRVLREFPIFFSYILVGVLLGFVRLWIYYHAKPRSYAWIYWISEILASLLAFLATYELLVQRLFPRFQAVRFYKYLFPTAATLIALVAVPAALQTHKVSILLMIIHVFDVLRVTLLVFLIGLMAFMGRQWSRYGLGIAMGLVVEASALLVNSAIWTQQLVVRRILLQLAPISYDVSAVIWLITFLKPEKPSAVPAQPLSPVVLTEARKWQEAAKGSLTKKKDSE